MHVEAKNRVQVESGHTSGRRRRVSLSRSRRWPLVASPYALRKRVCVVKVTDAVAGVRLSFNGSRNGRSLMPTFSKVNIVAITALSFLVAAPCVGICRQGWRQEWWEQWAERKRQLQLRKNAKHIHVAKDQLQERRRKSNVPRPVNHAQVRQSQPVGANDSTVNVRFWHLADIRYLRAIVRFWG